MKDYIQQAIRTEAPITAQVQDRLIKCDRLLHGAMGLMTEVGEFIDELKKHIFYGKELDKTNLKEEMGDKFWYMALILHELGVIDLTEVLKQNIAKLTKRYPEKFSEDKALNRDLEAERKELEQLAYMSPEQLKEEVGYGLEGVLPEKKREYFFDFCHDIFDTYVLQYNNEHEEIPPGKYLVLRLDDPDDKLGHAARMGARLFKKLIWEHDEHRRYADKLEQMLIAVEESLPPLKPTRGNSGKKETQVPTSQENDRRSSS